MESISARASFGTLFSFRALCLAPGDGDNIHVGPAIQKDAVTEFLHLAFNFLHSCLPLKALRKRDSSTGRSICASLRVKVRADISSSSILSPILPHVGERHSTINGTIAANRSYWISSIDRAPLGPNA